MSNKVFQIFFILCFFVVGISGQNLLRVPKGKNILPNGKFEAKEWTDAKTLNFESEIDLLTKQDNQNLYLGIRFLKDKHTGIDLYLAESISNKRMLHISSALGEKIFKANSWQEIRWGENTLWTANSIGLIVENNERKLLAPDGFEFQINKEMFESKKLALRIHLKRPEIFHPKNTSSELISEWIQLQL